MKEKLEIGLAVIIYIVVITFCGFMFSFELAERSAKIQPPETLIVNVEEGKYEKY